MEFYHLTCPDYKSDYEDNKNNPIEIIWNESIPSIRCNDCGIWAGSNRLRKDISFSEPAKGVLKKKILELNVWKKETSILKEELKLSDDDIWPGTQIGMPKGILLKNTQNNFIHPFPGMIWVTKKVMVGIIENGLSGVDFAKVNLMYKKNTLEKIDLWELIITGHAWLKGDDKNSLTVCKKCGRLKFPNGVNYMIDESRWNSTDFFNVDMNPNIVIITNRVKQIFEKNEFTNYLCRRVST